jgi:hypothetical protein
LGEVAAAVGRVHAIDTMGPEFLRLRPIATVVDDADQQLDAVAPHGLELLDVLIEAAIAMARFDKLVAGKIDPRPGRVVADCAPEPYSARRHKVDQRWEDSTFHG